MAENSNTGFVIPNAADGTPVPLAPPAMQGSEAPADILKGLINVAEPEGPQPRDYAIAGGVLLVLFIAFFFAKNAYANYLATRRVPPGAANAAGWWLFIFLVSLSTASALALVSPIKFLTPLFMLPLGLIALVAIVLMVLSGRRS